MYGHRLAGIFGYSHLTGGFAGGQAEYVRVPKGGVNLLPVPDGVSDEQVLYLSDVVCTSYHNVVDTGVKEGDVVAVWVSLSVRYSCFAKTRLTGIAGSRTDWTMLSQMGPAHGSKESHRDR